MSLSELQKFIVNHTIRGECRCGQCIDNSGKDIQPCGNTADLVFFKVAARNSPVATKLKELIASLPKDDVDLLDGHEHSYLEIGAWIGDQGIAMTLMGIGSILGLWDLLTPKMIPGISQEMALDLAGRGMLTIKAK